MLQIDLPWSGLVISLINSYLEGGIRGYEYRYAAHRVAREYLNTASQFTQIPKPQVQMGKGDLVNTTNPPFK